MFALRCFGALLSVYVRDVLMSTSAAFGVLNTLIGVRMIIGTQGPGGLESGDSESLLRERGDVGWDQDHRALQASGDDKGGDRRRIK
jgi:hypothetical protein